MRSDAVAAEIRGAIDNELAAVDAAADIDAVRGGCAAARDVAEIVGPARADIYLGAGDAAGRIAGLIRQQGRFAMLLPRELDMVAAGKAMPLPQPKPPTMVAQKGEEGQAQVLPRDVAEPQEEKTTWVNGALIARAQKWKTTRKRLSSFLSKRQPTGKGAAARS